MSALPPKADIDRRDGHVRFVAKAAQCTAAKRCLFDHLLGAGQHIGRDVRADRRRGVEVDHEFGVGRRRHRAFAFAGAQPIDRAA